MHLARLLIALPVLTLPAVAETAALPTSKDPEVRIELFAQEPLVKHPIGMTVDRDGRVLVIESHTHFPPKGYQGPAHDRILWLRDTDSDGKADKADVFFEGTDMTMDMANAPDGTILLSTRNEILRLHDDNRDGKADRADRKLLFLDTKASYPHNGISGLAFDKAGGLYFGVGENLGTVYTLTAKDGSTFHFNLEGGNVFHVDKDFGQLRRVATGFWNPFGVCVDAGGSVFATDNDPDSRPPCRLHHVIEGANFGYEYRYGRSGLHPFDAWNGELPGTLPMMAGLGEAPCDIIQYLPAAQKEFRGLPASWHGQLLVASWSDHTIEAYRLPETANAFGGAKKSVLVQGGVDFRPVAFAVAADGSMYVSDWVKRNYELHGFGRIWHVQGKSGPAPVVAPPGGIAEKQQQIDALLATREPTVEDAIRWLADTNAWRYSAAITRLSSAGELLPKLAAADLALPRQRAGLLLAAQRANLMTDSLPRRFLTDANPTVRLLALKWVADERTAALREEVEQLLADTTITPALFYGALTTLGRIESADFKEADMLKRLKERIANGQTPDRLKKMALQILSDRDKNLYAHEIPGTADPVFREWLMHVLGTLKDGARQTALRSMAFNDREPTSVRAAALSHIAPNTNDTELLIALAQTGEPALKRSAVALLQTMTLDAAGQTALVQAAIARGTLSSNRPPATDVAAWMEFLADVPGTPDPARGREVFLSPSLGSCITCHRMDGIGSIAGPNLSSIGSSKDPAYILESILQPNRNVAPQFEAFMLTTGDGQTRLAFLLMEHDATHTYVGLDGKTFDVRMDTVQKRELFPMSIMPEGLLLRLTDVEVRDLMAFLVAQK